jgi:hypothetical protein
VRFLTLLMLASCGPIAVTSVAYTTACPEGDAQCEIRQNAQTLYYMGQVEAGNALMCGGDSSVRSSLGDVCSLY